jgi:hypothetical protein
MGKFKFIEPELIKAGSDKLRLGLMRYVPKVDCRVLSEDTYQEMKKAYDIVCGGENVDTGERQLTIPDVNNCPAWLDADDFEYAKELYKESKIDAVKYLMTFARRHVTKPLKTCKELLDGCC